MTVSTKRGGRLKKSITVSTNIPGQDGTIRLAIQGEIWQPVDVKPMSANFGRLPPDATQSASLMRKLTIVNNMESEATLTNVRSTNPTFRAQTSVIEPGKKFELTVSVALSLQPGNNRGKIEMSTGIAEMPTLSVPVSAYLMSDVDVTPNKLALRSGQPRSTKRQFAVRNNTRQPLKISDLEASNPALKVALQETKPGTIFRITVDVPAGYRVPAGGDRITFKTDSPSTPVVTIPITEVSYPSRARVRRGGSVSQARSPSGTPKQKQAPPTPGKPGFEATKKPAMGNAKPKEAKPTGG